MMEIQLNPCIKLVFDDFGSDIEETLKIALGDEWEDELREIILTEALHYIAELKGLSVQNRFDSDDHDVSMLDNASVGSEFREEI
jgi:hypothetical protein